MANSQKHHIQNRWIECKRCHAPEKQRPQDDDNENNSSSSNVDTRPIVHVSKYRRMGYLAAFIFYIAAAFLTVTMTNSQPADSQYWLSFCITMGTSIFVIEPLYGALILLYHWMISHGEEGDPLELHAIEGQRLDHHDA